MSARIGSLMAVAVVAIAACADRTETTAPVTSPPIETPANVTPLRGTVDVIAGTLHFDAVRSSDRSRAGGPSAAIYGDQGVTVRIYNSPVSVTPGSPGKKQYTADVGVRNLLAHPIGDEQGGDPGHNNGIFVFITSGPTVTATSSPCSPACTVSAVNHHGTFAFTTLGQRYWFWPEQLKAAGQLGDTTAMRQTWTFEADTQVTAFQFEVLVSAHWPFPNDVRWKITYTGDSLPNEDAEPRWFRRSIGGGTTQTNTPSASMITLTTPAGGDLIYLRTDSLDTNSDAYIEATFAVNTATLTDPEISFGIDDGTKFIAVGASGSQAGFMTGEGSLTFQSGAVALTTTSFHTYQLRKYAADSAVLYIDGARQIHTLYSALPARLTGSAHGFYFGPLGTGLGSSVSGNSSTWDRVIYEMGVPQP